MSKFGKDEMAKKFQRRRRLTHIRGIVDQNDLVDEVPRRSVHDGVHCSKKR